MRFTETMDVVNTLKALFRLSEMIGDDRSEYPQEVVAASHLKKSVQLFSKMRKNLPQDAAVEEREDFFAKAKDSCFDNALVSYLDTLWTLEDDNGNPWYGREFWNHIAIPFALYEALEDYVTSIAKAYPCILGTEAQMKDKMPTSCCALSIYDLNDFTIVFDNPENMDQFIDENVAIDPVDLLLWNDGSWSALD